MQCDKEPWLSPGEARSLRDLVKKVDRKSRRHAVGHGMAAGDGDGDGGWRANESIVVRLGPDSGCW